MIVEEDVAMDSEVEMEVVTEAVMEVVMTVMVTGGEVQSSRKRDRGLTSLLAQNQR